MTANALVDSPIHRFKLQVNDEKCGFDTLLLIDVHLESDLLLASWHGS